MCDCDSYASSYAYSSDPKPATALTAERNRDEAARLGIDIEAATTRELELAESHCILSLDELCLRTADGRVAWSIDKYAFLKEDAVPDTVNASLWTNGKANRLAGVFCVVEGAIYQVRGFDLANLTIIRSKTGWIVQDVMTSIEASSAALDVLERALGEPVRENVRAVIISHSHSDHFGGILGVVSPEQVGPASEGKIPIFVPEGFDVASINENVIAGPAMMRRCNYQGGRSLEPGPEGAVSTGIGLWSSAGTPSYVAPTDFVSSDGPIVIDGIEVVFQLTPGTEAPAEMNNYFPKWRALWMAENCNGTLHNLYPIRGAKIRDASAWSTYILEAHERFADRTDVVFQAHNWPHFNTAEEPDAVGEFLLGTAAAYKYIHDQTLLAANKGATAKEIAHSMTELPSALAANWYTRPYYGSLQINARAVFEGYLGFWNGSPTDLDALTEREEAELFVRYAGGPDSVLSRAEAAFARGEYREAANAANRVVLAAGSPQAADGEPSVVVEGEVALRARQLTADAFEQLAYVAESGIWRNAYLQGAHIMRVGEEAYRASLPAPERFRVALEGAPADLLLAYAGIRLDCDKLAAGTSGTGGGAADASGTGGGTGADFTLTLTDGDGARDGGGPVAYRVHLRGGVLLAVRAGGGDTGEDAGLGAFAGAADASGGRHVRMSRRAFIAWVDGRLDEVRDEVESDMWELLGTLGAAFVDFELAEGAIL